MILDRPNQPQQTFDFGDEAEAAARVEEPQRGQSGSATAKQPALGQFSESLMEKIVDRVNMERAWKNVRRNGGAPGPDGITVDAFPDWLAGNFPLDANGAGSVNGIINSGNDVDVFRLVPTESGNLTIRQDASVDSNLDSIVEVLDQNGNPIAFDDDGGGFPNSRINLNVLAGQVLFIRSSSFATSTGVYDLTVTTNTGQDDFENTTALATTIALAADGSGQQSGDIETAFDVDVFRIIPPIAGNLVFQQVETSDSGVDPFLEVLDANGNVIAFNDDGGFGLNSRINLAVGPGEVVSVGDTLFVRAGAFSSTTGTYSLLFQTNAPTIDTVGDDNANAQNLPLGPNGIVIQPGTIDSADDLDVFRITANDTGLMTFQLDATGDGSLDPILRVSDGGGNELSEDDDGGFGLNSLIFLPANIGDVFFVEASSFGSTSGTFALSTFIDAGLVIVDDFGNDIASANATASQQIALPLSNTVTTQFGDIELAGDVDFFRVELPAGLPANSALQIRQIANPFDPFDAFLDPFVRIFDAGGNQIAFNDDDDVSLNSSTTVSVSAGDTIFVQAGAFGSSIGPYDLEFRIVQDDFGNTLSSATVVNLDPDKGTTVAPINGQINTAGDVDAFRITATQTGRMQIRQEGAGANPVDTFLTVFRLLDSGELEFIDFNDDSDGTLDSRVDVDVRVGETLVVFAEAFSFLTGGYELSVSTSVADDVGNTIGDSTPAILDANGFAIVSAEIDPDTDTDVFQVTADREGSLTAVLTLPAGSDLDARLSVFTLDGNGTPIRIASDFGSLGRPGRAITIAAETGRQYFFRIEGNQSTDGGYNLTFQTSNEAVESGIKIPENVFNAVVERLRQSFAQNASGAGNVAEVVLTDVVAEFIAALVSVNAGDESFAIFVFDPVDFLLTNQQNQQVGFTAGQGAVNEIAGAQRSSNSAVEVLILPTNQRSFNVQLQGVGTNYRIAGRLVSPQGVTNATVTGGSAQGSLVKGNLALVLDFNATSPSQPSPTPPSPPPNPNTTLPIVTQRNVNSDQIAGGRGRGGPASAVGSQLAFSPGAAAAIQQLIESLQSPDATTGLEAQQQLRAVLGQIMQIILNADANNEGFLSSLVQTLNLPIAAHFLSSDWFAGENDDNAASDVIIDLFWSNAGIQMLDFLIDFGGVIEQLIPEQAAEQPTDESARADDTAPSEDSQRADAVDYRRDSEDRSFELSQNTTTNTASTAPSAASAKEPTVHRPVTVQSSDTEPVPVTVRR